MLTNCLPAITALLQTQDQLACMESFCTLQQIFLKTDPVFFIYLDIDGRQLKCVDTRVSNMKIEMKMVCEVNDFSHPFSHVLHSKKRKIVKPNELIFWKNSQFFSKLSDNLAQHQDQLIYPIYQKESKLIGFFLTNLDKNSESLIDSNEFCWLINVFLIHFEQCALLSKHKNIQNELKLSLKNTKENMQYYMIEKEINKFMIGQSKAINELIKAIIKISPARCNVLIQGETGTGKELVAKAIHLASGYKNGALVTINCASIPKDLLESELFGFAKGAFTGANKDREGLIAAAHQGILFLDEIAEIPLDVQAKLLRVIETKHYRMLGSNTEQHSDFRLVTATHVNLKDAVANNLFRRDLFHRINQFTLTCLPLSERKTDIPILVNFFIQNFNKMFEKNILGCSDDVYLFLEQYAYSGNIRELKNIVECSCMLCEKNVLTMNEFKEFSKNDTSKLYHKNSFFQRSLSEVATQHPFLKDALKVIEKNIIVDVLRQHQLNRGQAAKSLGIPVRTLAHKCKVHNIN